MNKIFNYKTIARFSIISKFFRNNTYTYAIYKLLDLHSRLIIDLIEPP